MIVQSPIKESVGSPASRKIFVHCFSSSIFTFIIISIYRKNADLISLIRNKGYIDIKQYTHDLHGENYRIAQSSISLLECISKEEKIPISKEGDFEGIHLFSRECSKTIFLSVVRGLAPLFGKILEKSNTLVHFDTYFDIVLYFSEMIYQEVDLLMDQVLDCGSFLIR